MNLNVEVLEAAERDLLDAVRWYEENASRERNLKRLSERWSIGSSRFLAARHPSLE